MITHNFMPMMLPASLPVSLWAKVTAVDAALVGDVLRAGRGADANAPTNIGSGASVLRVIY